LFETVIENIAHHREPQPFEAMYIVMPTSQNVDRIIRDFPEGGPQQYNAAHLFFVDGSGILACLLLLQQLIHISQGLTKGYSITSLALLPFHT
jgi:uncharacterized caspase-like protein